MTAIGENIAPLEPFRIAVLSDLHAYDHVPGEPPSHLCVLDPEDQPGKHPLAALEHLIEASALTCDLLLCAGDIGDKANPGGIQGAWKWLIRLKEKFSATIVAATPGNHDVDSRYVYNKFDAKGVLQSLSPPYPLPFESEDTNDRFWSRNFVVLNRADFRLVLLNSSAFHGAAEKEIHHGRVSAHTLAALRARLTQSTAPPINILLCHHHPLLHQELDEPDYEVMQNGQLLLDMLGELSFGRWLVIHGHKHHPKIAYAPGGASAPVVFSAGSFAAHLYPTLSTRVRNQFYVIELPHQRYDELGFVGSIRAWDWAAGLGWLPAQSQGSGLPYYAGFGVKTDPILIAGQISKRMIKEVSSWSDMRAELPHIDFLLPRDLSDVLELLLTKHQIAATFAADGQPHELGRKSP
jgi:3',5'-cyclic AMP phosphodiesterase CpdA